MPFQAHPPSLMTPVPTSCVAVVTVEVQVSGHPDGMVTVVPSAMSVTWCCTVVLIEGVCSVAPMRTMPGSPPKYPPQVHLAAWQGRGGDGRACRHVLAVRARHHHKLGRER